MDNERLALMCSALGDPARVHILQFISGAECCQVGVTDHGDVAAMGGPTAGQICCHITGKERITSTISFHINKLKEAGLIHVERRGKYMVCNLDRDAMRELAQFFQQISSSGCC